MGKTFLLLSVLVAVAMAAPIDMERKKEVLLREILGILKTNSDNMGSMAEVRKEGDSDDNDPQPPEEIGTPAKGTYEGDLILTKEQKEAFENENNPTRRGGGTSNTISKWPNNIVPYVLDSSLSTEARTVIAEAMADWEKHTCTRFHPRTTEMHYIKIIMGEGCSSHLGRTGGGQPLSIGLGCAYKGTVIHELAHAQGIIHEQSRPDRDNYVTIMWNNIKSNATSQFEKHADASQEGPYDYSSVMHYGDKDFTRNGQRTIVAKDPSKQGLIGQRQGFSNLDIKHANKYLKCGEDGVSGGPKDSLPKEYCAHYVKIGDCKNPRVYLHCEKSCGEAEPARKTTTTTTTTPRTTTAAVSDKLSSYMCNALKYYGYCKYYKAECMKTCS